LLRFASEHPDRAIVTPHIAGATWESMHRTEVFLAERLRGLVSQEA
jgi:phosphoglycerate dehydrogenase-like enzyme